MAFINIFTFAFINFFLLLGLSFIFWMAVDAAKHDRYWWIVLIFGVPLIGAAAYFFIGKGRARHL